MFTLIVKGARNSTLAVHHCDTELELQELVAVYELFGYAPQALLIEERAKEQAA